MERPGAYLNNAIVRLAAYEDTGLTPEEVESLLSVREITPEAEYAINKHADSLIERMDALLHKDDELEAYRATGLKPEEVMPLATVEKKRKARLANMQVGKTLDGAPVGLILPKLNTSAGMEAIKDIPPQRLVELAQAERDGRLVVSRFKHGDCVWAIERDEYGEALDVAGSMFLAEVLGFVIASAYINGMTEAQKTLSYHMQETVEGYDTTLMVFPSEDVYQTKAEAETALREAAENA